MGDVVRLNASPADEDSWWVQGGGGEEPSNDALVTLIPWERRDHSAALDDLSNALWTISAATSAADSTVTEAADALTEGIDFTDAAGTVALIQDIRRRLQVVEQYMTKRLGEAATEVERRSGELPDGRLWEVRRGKVRKSWDHESWKHDARARIADQVEEDLDQEVVAYTVDPQTGETVDLNFTALLIAAMTAAQEVHGSTAPRVTQLRALGMDPDEYAQTSPGPWGLVVASTDPTTTITQE